ncbi:flagellin N-terminal helical domain-containing protein [Aureimonas ureilytica]|uniref:flagellin N-terminal helical domain-containing protein n=1 Tax=Aureimonas ureilytica TaxID=401562 RepID=UPI0003602DDB|nr:flagellin [Aureimonas ureilytica]
MTSVNTNIAAITALRNLQQTQSLLEGTQNRISTGLKIGEAKDNAAYWSIATTLRSDNKSLATVKDALSLGSATVDTAYQGLNKAKDVLDEIKSKLTAASQDGVDRSKIQTEIAELQKQLKSIANSASFSGENWLSVNSDLPSFNANKNIVSSFSRDASGAVTLGSIGIDISDVKLFDSAGGGKGILDKAVALKDANGVALTVGGQNAAPDPSVTALTFSSTPATGVAAEGMKGGQATLGTLNLASVTDGDQLRFSLSVDGRSGIVNVKTSDILAANGNLATITGTLQTAVNSALGDNMATVAIDATTKAVTITSNSFGTNSTVAVGETQTVNGDGTVTALAGLLTAASLPAPTSGTGTKAAAELGTFVPAGATAKAEQTLLATAGNYSMTAGTATQVLTGFNAGAPASGTFTFDIKLNGVTTTDITATFGDGAATQDETAVANALQSALDDKFTWTSPSQRKVTVSGDTAAHTITFTTVDGGASQSVSVSNLRGPNRMGTSVGAATPGTGGINVGDKITFEVTYGTTTKPVSITITADDMDGTNGLTPWATKNKPTAAELQALLQKRIDTAFGSTKFNGKTDGTGYSQGDIILSADLTKLSTKNAVGSLDNIQLTNVKLTQNGTTTNGLAGIAGTNAPASGTGYRIQGGDSISFKVQYGTDWKVVTRNFVAADFTGSGAAAGWATPGQPTAEELAAVLQKAVNDEFAGSYYNKVNSNPAGLYVDNDIKLTVDASGKIGVETKKTGKDMAVGISELKADIAGTTVAAEKLFGLDVQTKSIDPATGNATTSGTVGWGTATAATFAIGTFDNTDLTGADTISFSLNVNGTVKDVSIKTDGFLGGSGNLPYDKSRFQAKMQAALDTAFGTSDATKVTFNVEDADAGNKMTLTTKAEGANASIAISGVQAFDGDNVTTSRAGLTNITSATPVALGSNGTSGSIASLTSTGTFTGPQTLGDSDKISLDVTVDGTTKRIDIDKDRVNAALGRRDGKIGDAAAYATVLNSAFGDATSGFGPGVLNATASGDTLSLGKVAAGGSLAISGVTSSSGVADTVSIETLDISDAKLRTLGVTSANQNKVFAAYISAVNDAINNVTTAASNLGSLAKRIDLQQTFVSTMMDTIDKGVGKLVDADLSEESTRLQALQTKQQLGVQTLSIANQSAQSILALFRG